MQYQKADTSWLTAKPLAPPIYVTWGNPELDQKQYSSVNFTLYLSDPRYVSGFPKNKFRCPYLVTPRLPMGDGSDFSSAAHK